MESAWRSPLTVLYNGPFSVIRNRSSHMVGGRGAEHVLSPGELLASAIHHILPEVSSNSDDQPSVAVQPPVCQQNDSPCSVHYRNLITGEMAKILKPDIDNPLACSSRVIRSNRPFKHGIACTCTKLLDHDALLRGGRKPPGVSNANLAGTVSRVI